MMAGCSDRRDDEAYDRDFAAVGDDKLERERWHATRRRYYHDFSEPCGDPVHSVDVEWLIAEIDRLRAMLP